MAAAGDPPPQDAALAAAKEHAFRMYGLAGQTAVVTGGTKVTIQFVWLLQTSIGSRFMDACMVMLVVEQLTGVRSSLLLQQICYSLQCLRRVLDWPWFRSSVP